MNGSYRISGYKIVSDPEYWIDKYNITPELEYEMPQLEKAALKGKMSAARRLQELIERHPHNPQLKNLLSVLYVHAGKYRKARELNRRIEAEHPNYLFAKINKAATHLNNKEYDKVPAVLGDTMELRQLCPEREDFFISEFLSFYKMASLYFTGIEDFESAAMRIEMMKQAAPDHPDTEYAEKALVFAMSKKAVERLKREEEMRITPERQGRPLPPQRTEAPRLTHEACRKMYARGWDFTEEEIKEFLELPRESFIRDLTLLLEDAFYRFDYHQELFSGGARDSSNFALHAMLLLGEMEAEESLVSILDFLSYEDECINFYLGDALTELIWQVIYKTGQGQPEMLRDFLLEPGIETYCKTPVLSGLAQIALYQSKRRNEIIALLRDVLNGFANAKPGDNLLDTDVTGFLVVELLNIGARELEPEIKRLHELEYVNIGICGSWEVVEKNLKSDDTHRYEVEGLQEHYDWLRGLSATWENEFDEDYVEDEVDYMDDEVDVDEDNHWSGVLDKKYAPASLFNSPVVSDKKVGRNEPCPCGSGKKYKKCCG